MRVGGTEALKMCISAAAAAIASALSDNMLQDLTPLTPIQTKIGWVFGGAASPAHDMDAAPIWPEATPGLRAETIQMLIEVAPGSVDRHAC